MSKWVHEIRFLFFFRNISYSIQQGIIKLIKKRKTFTLLQIAYTSKKFCSFGLSIQIIIKKMWSLFTKVSR